MIFELHSVYMHASSRVRRENLVLRHSVLNGPSIFETLYVELMNSLPHFVLYYQSDEMKIIHLPERKSNQQPSRL